MNQNNHNIYGYKAIIYMPFFLVPNSHTHINYSLVKYWVLTHLILEIENLNYSTCIVKVDFL